MGIIDKVFGDKAERLYKREQKYFSENPAKNHLFIQKTKKMENTFNIYDVDGNLKYYVREGMSFETVKNYQSVNIKLYDTGNHKIGSVKKNILSLRVPIFHEDDPADYSIDIYGKRVAKLKTKIEKDGWDNYEVVPFSWIVKRNHLKWDFNINNDNWTIAHICKRKGYDLPTFILDIQNDGDELICLLIVLTLICIEYFSLFPFEQN